MRALLVILTTCLLCACNKGDKLNIIKFATSAEYPPFEYKVGGNIQGFDIELAKLIAKEMGKEAIFEDMQFSAILAALQNHQVDAAIATITVTKERQKQFDFSHIYYIDGIALVYPSSKPFNNKADLKDKKIACQLGSTMELWLKKNGYQKQMVVFDNNNLAIEALKSDLVDAVLMDGAQGYVFSHKSKNLSYKIIDQSEDGYAIVTQKNSPLLEQINQAITKLKENGEIARLEEKWLKGSL